jgi:hypothetical protein
MLRNLSSSGTVSFAAKVDMSLASNAGKICLGDFNRDGHLDIGGANTNGNFLLTNTGRIGNISFALSTSPVFYVPTDFATVAGYDINSDGYTDLLTGRSTSTSVIRRNGTSSGLDFVSRDSVTITQPARDLSLADVDGDGNLDLITSNATSNTISVYRNTGSFSLASPVTIGTATMGSAVFGNLSIADYNGDGKPDIALTCTGANTVAVFRNTSTSGTISFVSPVNFATGNNPCGPSSGDLDGDGKPELVIANSLDNTISIIRNSPVLPISGGGTIRCPRKMTAPVSGGTWNS